MITRGIRCSSDSVMLEPLWRQRRHCSCSWWETSSTHSSNPSSPSSWPIHRTRASCPH